MTRFVVDTSVAVKWFVPEVHSEDAAFLLAPDYELHAPDLLPSEFGNTLWKKFRREELGREDVETIARALPEVPLHLHASMNLLSGALDIAVHTSRTVYDSLYLCLAVALDCRFVTADERLCDAIEATGLARRVVHVGEL